MGRPRVELTVAASVPVAFVSAKLCDVAPDGRSALVTRGILNLAHRASDEHPEPVSPGEPVTATIELDATAYVFEPGHRVRLDLAGSDFPSSWPPPAAGTIEIDPRRLEPVPPRARGSAGPAGAGVRAGRPGAVAAGTGHVGESGRTCWRANGASRSTTVACEGGAGSPTDRIATGERSPPGCTSPVTAGRAPAPRSSCRGTRRPCERSRGRPSAPIPNDGISRSSSRCTTATS